ncbi:hypothetical protein EV210_101126 [Anaerospora hongkongensis]|uniref:Uncharacterized protein n=1 Tax=Anaerospora hongkongensis TaxID=244830 RepID=A0A4R1Q365_9FIRM|nr:hypothetical protein EV210_101126 [Anaerospora hongkongensis]
MITAAKTIMKTATTDLYTLFMISLVVYVLSFMSQWYERSLIRVLVLVIVVDGIMKILSYLLE